MKYRTIEEALSVLEGVKGSGTQYTALCPAHDDTSNSLSITSKEGRAVCHCFAGCDASSVWKAINDRLGTPEEEAPKSTIKRTKVLVASYDYVNVQGYIIDTKYRYKPKGFSWKRGTAGRSESLPPYNLPRVLDASSVYVVEGEKDADTLQALGVVATSSKDGFTAENMHYFTGKDLYIIEDNDTKGEDIARKAAALAVSVAKSVKVVCLASLLPSLPPKGDTTDYIQAGGTLEDLKAYIDTLPAWIQQEEVSHPHTAIYKDIEHYSIDKHGRLIYTSESASSILCYGSLAIIEEVRRHDGEEASILFKVEGVTEEGKKLPPVMVPASDLAGLAWLPKCYGSLIVPAPTQAAKQKLVAGIMLTGRKAAQKVVYTHTGYLMENKKPISYIHAQGHVLGSDTLEASIIDNLKQYRLSEGSSNYSESLEAMRASLALLRAHAPGVCFPLFAFVYVAPLLPIVKEVNGETGFCLYLQGKTQSGKSTLAALAMSHFGKFTAMTPPVTFNSTANYINELSFMLKDSVLWVDDYHPQGTKREADKQAQIFQSIARAAGDHAQRGRLTSAAKLQAMHKPRCLFLATGEDVPQIGQSGTARLFTLEVSRHREDIKQLRQAARSGILSRAMSDYIAYIIEHYEDMKAYFQKVYDKAFMRAIEHFGESRLSGQATLLYCAAVCFLYYAKVSGCLTSEEASKLNRDFWENIHKTAQDIEANIRSQDPARMYIKALRELLSSGQRFVIDLNNPEKYASYSKALGADGSCIGWKDTQYFYMDPHASFKAVNEYYSKEGSFFNASRPAVHRDLMDIGALVTTEGSTDPTITKVIKGYKSVRVLRFNVSTFEAPEGGAL